jgi:phosphatidyl-myo-inositol alpha-mannosyltransferase
MRVALACPYAWDAPGGVQVHVRQLGRRLRDRGHDVLVLAPAYTAPAEPWVKAVGSPIRIPFNGSVAPVCPFPGSARTVVRELRDFEPDVVHAHEPLVLSTAMFATIRAPSPVVATFHAYADRAVLFSTVAPALRPVWDRLRVRLAVSRAAAEFVELRFSGELVRVIPNGADVELFAAAKPATGLPTGRRILFVNRLDPRKGFRVMVEAFARVVEEVPDALLVVAGDGAEREAVDDLPQAARERVVMLGSVPHEELPPYHAASEVFAAPAVGRESFGIVLVEAMAAGLPVVASDIPGYREVVRDGVEGILVSPRDPEGLAAALLHLVRDPDVGRRLGQAGRERARRYSWDLVVEELEAVYREAAGSAA